MRGWVVLRMTGAMLKVFWGSLIYKTLVLLILVGYQSSISPLFAQELQLRRWNHLPINRNFLTGNYATTQGEIAFDPVLRIEDAVETDEIFTVLMGEHVEPRREFINDNALEVSMLDI